MKLLGEEKLGDAKYWGSGVGRVRGYSQNKGGVALHHQLLSSKGFKNSQKKKKRKKKRPLFFILRKNPIKKTTITRNPKLTPFKKTKKDLLKNPKNE
jgi:hypothetical protein